MNSNRTAWAPRRLLVLLATLAAFVTAPAGAQASEAFSFLKDITPGASGSSPIAETADVDGTLFFTANDGVNGNELWKSDGTPAGTTLVEDILPGGVGSSPAEFLVWDDTLFFSADDGVSGRELWRSDGTPAGTFRIADINPGAGSSTPLELTRLGNRILFRANDGTVGAELWRTDGSPGGTVLVEDIRLGATGSGSSIFTAAGNLVFFQANDNVNGFELWKSDGTAAGTELLDIEPGAGGSFPLDIEAIGSQVLVSAFQSGTGVELFKSDGTPAGTNLLTDLNAGASGSEPEALAAVGDNVYFSATTPATGYELFKTDGTASGTTLVEDLVPGASSSFPQSITDASNSFSDRFFFRAVTSLGYELWVSDGTPGGTDLVEDINPGAADSFPSNLTVLGSRVYFMAQGADSLWDVWQSNGNAAGTFQISDDDNQTGAVTPLAKFNGRLIAERFDPVHGFEPWVGRPISDPIPAVVPFPSTQVGSRSSASVIEINNAGVAPLHPTDVRITDGNAGDFHVTHDGCSGLTIPAGLSCEIRVAFEPTATGFREANVLVLTDETDGGVFVPIAGNGTAAPPAGDTTPPDVHFTSGPAGLTNDSTPTFGFAMSEAGTLQCRTDGSQFAGCTSPSTTAALTDGPHTFTVRATDTAGNRSTVEREVLVDTTAPQTTLAAVPPKIKAKKKKKAKLTFNFSASEGSASLQCSIDGASFAACTSPLTATFKKGTHTFAVRSTDKAQNTDASPAQASFKVKLRKKKKKK
jgi:ELWxxDGT repeat protein